MTIKSSDLSPLTYMRGWGFLLFFRSSLKNGLNNAKRTLWVSTCWPGHLHRQRQGSHLWTPCPPTALWMRRGCFQWCRSIWRQIWEDIWLTGEDLCNTNFKESIKVLRFFLVFMRQLFVWVTEHDSSIAKLHDPIFAKTWTSKMLKIFAKKFTKN